MIYLDHAATSWPKPPGVAESLTQALARPLANSGRSGHQASIAAAREVYRCRSYLAELFHIPDSRDLVFTRGTTEGINLVLRGFLRPGMHVATSPLEHNAVMRPLRRLEAERNIRISTLPADEYGRVSTGESASVLGHGKPDLLVLAHVSNVNGVTQDLAAIRRSFPDVPILLDAAQSAGVLEIDVQALRLDFLCCSLHKGLLGPTGLGACYIHPKHDIPPLMEGGTGSASEEEQQPLFRPDRYEAGTLNLHGILAANACLQGLSARGLLGGHKKELCHILCEGLQRLPGVSLQSPLDEELLCLSFTVRGQSVDHLALALEEEHGILCRPGLHCAPAAHRHLGTAPEGSIRFAPGFGNTPDEMQEALAALAGLLARVS